MSDMADVLEMHQRKTGVRDLHQHCICGWFSKPLGNGFIAHQAAALSAAGFGPVQAARAEALEEAGDAWGNAAAAVWLRARARTIREASS